MPDNLKSPIIFFGFGRSGTTIISNIVFRHPKLAWVSNYQDKLPQYRSINVLRNIQDNSLWRIKKPNNAHLVSFFFKFLFLPSESYSFWNWVTKREFGRSFFWEMTETENRNAIREVCSNIVKYQKRERFSFKITGPSRLEYLHSIFPDAKFVWIKRSPLPNIRSLLNIDFFQDRKHELWWKGDVYSSKELKEIKNWNGQAELIAAIQYYKVHEVFQLERQKLNIEKNIYVLQYEDFIKNSDREMKNLLEFLNLDYHDNVKSYLRDREIYNANRKQEFYLSSELDDLVLKIATEGIG
ncbi:sulfotransferase family protein [Fodinibius saliphilus]|uniref:sulfotransferase family protein n=1 Tax=Fodinibius saliphilus TaxID=1920650 RepID=UPI0011086D9E|nr:sulfotransferase [Fodinibius saliphilus]